MTVPIDPQLAFEAASAGLKTLDSLLTLIETSRSQNRELSLTSVVLALPGEAHDVAARIVARIEELRQSFDKYAVNMDKPISELQREYGWWHLRRYRLVRDFNGNMRSLADALNDLLGDFVAIAHCRGAEELIAGSFQKIGPIRTEIDQIVNNKDSVRTIFEKMIKNARELQAKAADLALEP